MSEIAGSHLGNFDWVLNVHRCAVTMLLLVRISFKEQAEVIINLSRYTKIKIQMNQQIKNEWWITGSGLWKRASSTPFQHCPCAHPCCSQWLEHLLCTSRILLIASSGDAPKLSRMKGLSQEVLSSHPAETLLTRLYIFVVSHQRYNRSATTGPQSRTWREYPKPGKHTQVYISMI